MWNCYQFPIRFPELLKHGQFILIQPSLRKKRCTPQPEATEPELDKNAVQRMRFRHKNHDQAGLATDETITKAYQVAATPARARTVALGGGEREGELCWKRGVSGDGSVASSYEQCEDFHPIADGSVGAVLLSSHPVNHEVMIPELLRALETFKSAALFSFTV
jgi:hypothetical protein